MLTSGEPEAMPQKERSAIELMGVMRCLPNLRRHSSLADTVEKALRIVLPKTSAASCVKLLRSGPLPSKSTIGRSQSVFDAAMLADFCKRSPLHNNLIRVWVDASPQATFELFQSEILMIRRKDVVRAMLETWELSRFCWAAREFSIACGRTKGDDDDDSSSELEGQGLALGLADGLARQAEWASRCKPPWCAT